MAPDTHTFCNNTDHIPRFERLQATIWSHHYNADGQPYEPVILAECRAIWALIYFVVGLALIILAYEYRHIWVVVLHPLRRVNRHPNDMEAAIELDDYRDHPVTR